eukprot:Gb_28167 [translate_table: standard]
MAGSLYGIYPGASRKFSSESMNCSGKASSGLRLEGSRVEAGLARISARKKVCNEFNSKFSELSCRLSTSPTPVVGRMFYSDQGQRKAQPFGHSTCFRSDSRAYCMSTDGNESFFPEEGLQGDLNSLYYERQYPFLVSPSCRGWQGGVPVFVMLPLNIVNMNGQLTKRKTMNVSLMALKSAGVEGIMVNVWWGIVEKDVPGEYNWAGYAEIIEMARNHGLKVQAVIKMHRQIPLPSWVSEEIVKNPDLTHMDKEGRRNMEYISVGCDALPVLKGRSPIQVYSDFMRSFRDNFNDFLGQTIMEIQVGMGPAGELRYPSYPESNNSWRFPGIGQFQCFDKYMIASLKACAEEIGKAEWGIGGPQDAGNYMQWPEETGFFKRDGSWNTRYGDFFLEWYSGMLLMHGERISAAAEAIFRSTGAKLSGKVAGIHWHYGTKSHSAELTAGYYNTSMKDGYLPIARMFGRHGVTLRCTCFEMLDSEQQPFNANCSPEGLLRQLTFAARKSGIPLAGENARTRFDDMSRKQIIKNSSLCLDDNLSKEVYEPVCSFSFLRMSEQLFHRDNWSSFVQFVRQMADGRNFQRRKDNRHRATASNVQATVSIEEAEAATSCQ